jgi:hypothetical protein
MRYTSISLILLWIQVSQAFAQVSSEYNGQVTFPANYSVGDYIEFLEVSPMSAGASGYYELSISYTRGNVAAGATYLASISHHNPSLWREVGKINSNGYAGQGSAGHNFTIDCNTYHSNVRFRIRAINTLGIVTSPLVVRIKVRSISQNAAWTTLNATGSDLSVDKMLPMTNDWSLYVGNPFQSVGANLAIKAITNGNVGIGTENPQAKLAVNGTVLAKEVKVKNDITVPDYVFEDDYQLPALNEIEAYVKENKHLPEIPSAKDIERDGLNLAEMNLLLLKKVEELTLHLIEKEKEIKSLKSLEARIESLERKTQSEEVVRKNQN